MSGQSMSPGEPLDINNFISPITTLHTSRIMVPDVFPCENLPAAIRYILYNNTIRKNYEILTDEQEQMFEIIEKLREQPQTMFMYLKKNFAKYFDLDLRIIAVDNGKFSLIPSDENKKEHMVFVLFNEDNTVHGPLYNSNFDGTKETVFSIKNWSINVDIYLYVMELNDKKLTEGSPQIQEEQAVHCEQELRENSSTGDIPSSADQLTISFDPNQMDTKTQSRIVLNEMLQQVFRIFDGLPIDPCTSLHVLQPFVSHVTSYPYLSPPDAILASRHGIDSLASLVQIAEQAVFSFPNAQINTQLVSNDTNIQMNSVHQIHPSTCAAVQNDNSQTSTNAEIPLNIPASNHDLTTTVNRHNDSIQRVENYDPPALNKPLKGTIHPRNLKEFAGRTTNPIKCIGSKQRAPIVMRVPHNDGTVLYVEMEVLDMDDDTHLLKIIVPDKTEVKDGPEMNNNDLKCLNFTKCNKSYHFKDVTRCLYSKIISSERRTGTKQIRIHMINLYRRGEISRKGVPEKNLKQCRLAFCFCTSESGEYKRVSPRWCSNVIEDCIVATGTKRKETTTNEKPKRLCQKAVDVPKDYA